MTANRQTANRIVLYCAGADCADRYRADSLDAADRLRLAACPQLAAQTRWQVSRYLKSLLPAGSPHSLSHCGGTAAVAAGADEIGVDVERMRPRDFAAWHDGWLNAAEQDFINARGRQMQDYYLVWTLKEALVKAAGLGFADLPDVGLADGGTLRAAGRHWQGRVWRIGGGNILACVWAGGGAVCEWRGIGAAAAWEKYEIGRFQAA